MHIKYTPGKVFAAIVAVLSLIFVVGWAPLRAIAVNSESIWGASSPSGAYEADYNSVELGTRFTPTVSGQAVGVRFYKAAEDSSSHTGALWSASGTKLASVKFSNESASGWQSAGFASPVNLVAGTSYVVSYHTSDGYFATANFSGSSVTPDLSVPSVNAGVYRYGTKSGFPTSTWNSSMYWADVAFVPSSSSTPVPSTTTSSTSATPTATVSSTPTATVSSTTPVPTVTSTTPAPTTTTTTPAPTTTTTVPSTGQTNCAAKPSDCGYPDATNTGVQDTSVLRRVPQDITSGPGWFYDTRGWITADTDGAVVENIITTTSVEVQANNVTVRNNVFNTGGDGWAVAIRHASGTIVTGNTIGILGGSPRLMVGVKDIYGDASNTQVTHNNIQNTSTGVQTYEGLIGDNYIHDMGYQSGDHINGTTSNGSTTPLTIRHNTVFNQYDQTDAISLFQDFGIEANRTITDNLVAGGGYTIYGGDNERYGKTYNIVITNNRFSKKFFPNSGYYGPLAAFDSSGSGNVYSGNYWDENLTTV